jgi:hypothetical protein
MTINTFILNGEFYSLTYKKSKTEMEISEKRFQNSTKTKFYLFYNFRNYNYKITITMHIAIAGNIGSGKQLNAFISKHLWNPILML